MPRHKHYNELGELEISFSVLFLKKKPYQYFEYDEKGQVLWEIKDDPKPAWKPPLLAIEWKKEE